MNLRDLVDVGVFYSCGSPTVCVAWVVTLTLTARVCV